MSILNFLFSSVYKCVLTKLNPLKFNLYLRKVIYQNEK